MQQIERAHCIATNKQSILEPSAMAKDKDHKDHKKPKEKDKEKEKKETKSKEPVSKPKEEVFEELAKKKSHGGEQGEPHKEIKAGDAVMVHKAGASSGPGHERPGGARFITLAGENRGASMKIGAMSKDKERLGQYWLDDDDDDDTEEGRKGVPALINSNVQVINNSLLLRSSCSGGDPWVHLKLSAQSKSKDKQQQLGVQAGRAADSPQPAT